VKAMRTPWRVDAFNEDAALECLLATR